MGLHFLCHTHGFTDSLLLPPGGLMCSVAIYGVLLVLRFLSQTWTSFCTRTGLEHHKTIAANLWAYCQMIDICKGGGTFLSAADAHRLEEARSVAFTSHCVLAHGAQAANSQLWRTLPKHHYLDHLCRPHWPDASGSKNPGHGWCFADEDFIGRLTRISSGRMRIETLLKKYLLRLHLVLERGSTSAPAL